jgi:hypothetical protein
MQQAAVAVTASNKERPLPTPTNTVVACHQGLGMSAYLQSQNNFDLLK